MLKRLAFLFLILAPALYGQEVPTEIGSELNAGKAATLGVEASTAFAYDIENNSSGLETKAGMELIFPLFPTAHRGVFQDDYSEPAVRLFLKDLSFTWLNTFETSGGNYEQDSFNRWQARPLVVTFDTFLADVVWTNFFLRVASSTTVMQTNQVSLFSIFDDVMDARDRWYYRGATRALWFSERYNIQDLPLLKKKLVRDYTDDDFRNDISGILAFGAEFDWFSVILKTASNKSGLENEDNAWLVGADIEVVPLENFKIDLTGFAGFNYEKVTRNVGNPVTGDIVPMERNPVNFGVSAQYRLSLSDRFYLTPKAGFDFGMDTVTNNYGWEVGAGVLFHTRGHDSIASSRLLDWAEVIPVGASVSMNMNDDNGMNMIVSMFEPAGPDSLLPYFGGFLQLELANLLGANNSVYSFGLLAQVEYMIAEMFTPYIRGGYVPEFQAANEYSVSGNYLILSGVGIYITPVHFFSIDLRYEMGTMLLDAGGTETVKSLISAVFTIQM